MIAAFRYEWTRIRTLRSTYWIVGVALVLQATVGCLIAWGIASSSQAVAAGTAFEVIATAGASTGGPPLLIAYLLGILGVLTFGHEYRYGLSRATLTAVPSRPAIFIAKLVVVGAVVAIVATVAVLLTFLIQPAFGLGPTPTGADAWNLLVGVVIYTVLFTWSGLGFAALFRNQTIAMLILLFVPTVVEYVVRFVVLIIQALSDDPLRDDGLASLLKYLPFDAGGQMYTRWEIGVEQMVGGAPLSAVAGGVLFGCFVGAILLAGAARFQRSDA